MRLYLRSSLVIVLLAAAGCGDGKPSTDARDGASDGKNDGSMSDRADVGGDKPATGGNGGSSTGSGGATGGSAGTGTGGDAGTGTGGSAGTGTGGGAGNDGGAGADGGGNDGATATCNDGIKNSDETGVDCGGHCGKCAPGGHCEVNADCQYACRADKTCAACMVASDCPGAETECEHRTCTAGVCGSTRETAGTVLTVQATGDCKRRQCAADGTVATVNDDSDVPEDRNPCTNDICTTGVASHTMMPANSSCGGANHCNANGQCIGCTVAADCPGSDTACRTRTCTTGGLCGFSFAAAGTKLVDPTAGDCKGLQCDGNGNEQVWNNDADKPVDNNVCTTDECSSGTPAHRPVVSGTNCGGSLVCDGASKCVECLSASTCPGTDAECHTRSCMNGACGVANMAMGTLVAAQTARDCKKNVCNGQGGVTTVSDDLDLPVDSNACTFDVCTAGTPSNPNVPAGNSCGSNTICDGQGACVTCLTASSCPGTDTECHHRTCTNGVCGIANTTAGTALSTQTAGDCKRSQCDGNGASVVVNDDADKPVDGKACTSDICTNGVPSNPNLASGTACGTSQVCNATGDCVGCNVAADCGTNTTCQTHTCTNNVCAVTNAAAGTLLPNQTTGDCKRVQCDGQGQSVTVNDDTDKLVDGNACTKDLCNAGIASNPPEDSGTACSQNNGTKCNATGSCVQCLVAADCPGTDNECHHRTCTAGVCGIANTTDGTAVQNNPTGDCKKNVCMGGAQVTVNDDLDLPVDGNSCTNDLCNAGSPSHTPVAKDTACNEGGGTRCNATGTCVACTANSQCGTDSVCQTFTCSTAGQCVTNNVANGMALPPGSQTGGDCKTKVCNGNGGVTDAANDQDVPNDGNPCTDDACNSGVPSNTSRTAGALCSQGGNTMCNGSATAPACVQCVGAANCGTDTFCKTFTCAAGQCSSSNTADGTLVDNAGMGDCQKNVCMNGAITMTADNADVPEDSNACTTDTCSAGVPQHNNVSVGVSCGISQMCDGAGLCVGCVAAENCPTGNACQVRICGPGGVCGFTNRAAGFVIAAQTTGDCQHDECDGNGAIRTVNDDNDTPAPTGSQCMQPTCSAGVPSQTPLTAGAMCTQNMGKECDGTGTCVECLIASECPGTDGPCQTRTCTSGVCGISFKDAGTPTMSQVSGDCKLSICDGAGHDMDINDNDPPAPTNDCMTPSCSNGSVTLTAKAHGSTCSQNNGRTCDGAGVCRLTFDVVRVGTGSAALSNIATAAFIEEHVLSTGALVGSALALPVADSLPHRAFSLTGTGSGSQYEGQLSLSQDGKYVVVAGYARIPGTTGTLPNTTAATVNRMVARIDAANAIDTRSLFGNSAFSGNNVRGVTTLDGSRFWGAGAGGANAGIWMLDVGTTTATQIFSTAIRWVGVNPAPTGASNAGADQLYGTGSNSPLTNVFTAGTGVPTASPITTTTLADMPTTTSSLSPVGFVLFDRDGTPGAETLYMADDGGTSAAEQGVQKWTYGASASCVSSPCWTRAAIFSAPSPAAGIRGLTGFVSGSNVVLIATTNETSANRVITFVDDGSATITGTVVTTAAANTVYRGVALAPHL
jgi:hypothetical protein